MGFLEWWNVENSLKRGLSIIVKCYLELKDCSLTKSYQNKTFNIKIYNHNYVKNTQNNNFSS